jgi:hypothetical protein
VIRARRFRTFAVVAVLALLVAAATAWATVREVGATSNFTAPDCTSADTCQPLSKMTIFQLKVDGRSNVTSIPRDGKVMALSLYLPRVTADLYSNFTETFGGAPTAKLSILRKAKNSKTSKYRYTLVAQSERFNVKNYLGGAPTFALGKPLKVKKGDQLALTTDTWMPGIVVRDEDATSTWRSSRPKGKCTRRGESMSNLTTPRMHKVIGQIKRYDCLYTGARVLYHATVVDTPVKR